jgi:hypothetical protein
MNIRRDKDIVHHQQRQRQYRGRTQDVQRIRQRNEPPFRRGQIADVTDHHAERDEIGQDAQQKRDPVKEIFTAVEAQIKTGEHRQHGRQGVM